MMKPTQTFPPARIYIVNDSIEECQTMSNSLSRAGYKVNFATNGREGLQVVLENPPQCLILNDVLAGTSGFAISRQVRTIPAFQKMLIIIIGIQNSQINQKYAFRMGANSYLAKPFPPEALMEIIKQVLPLPLQPLPPRTGPLTQALPPHSKTSGSQALPPLSSQQSTVPVSPTMKTVATIVPYRPSEANVMLQSNPFARSSVMADKNTRRLYALIDGQKNIQQLADMMQINLAMTLQLLKLLWQQKHIAFYDEKRNPLKNLSFLEESNLSSH